MGIRALSTEKGHKEDLEGSENICYHDGDGGYTGVYICQNSSSCSLKMSASYFIITFVSQYPNGYATDNG